MPQRVGLLGGTFDPVHLGHLRIAEEAFEELSLDRVILIPAADPPHKEGKAIAPFVDRWEMLRIAIEGNPRFELSDVERRIPGKSFTVVTLKRLREEMPRDTDFFLLVGLDAFFELHTWWHFRELFSLATIVVLHRPGFEPGLVGSFLASRVSLEYREDPAAQSFRHPVHFPVRSLLITPLEISSTHLRRLVAANRSIRYLVLPEVMRYIAAKNLYKSGSDEERNQREEKD